MPFFRFSEKFVNFSTNIEMMKKNKKIKIDTLQVRIPAEIKRGRKRVFFFASASMTVEAAIALPLFLFAGVIMLMPFRIMDVERRMQAIVNSVGEEISQTAYMEAGSAAAWGSAAAFVYAEGAVRMKASDLPVEKLSLAGSELLEDGETVNLRVTYKMKLPFSVFRLDAVECTNACFLRAWVGSDGGGGAERDDLNEDDPIVYVGKGSTRYHISASCHYLDNRLTAVSRQQVDSCRNDGGSRYKPCVRCASQAGDTVYIMPSGESYHASRDCSAIRAYVSAVRLSEVRHLGACSYCSGSGG